MGWFRKRRVNCMAEDQECANRFLAKFHRSHKLHRREMQHYYWYFRYFRPVVLVINLVILYLLFSWGGFKEVGIFIAVILILKEIGQFIFLLRLEKRIIKPIEQLRRGVNEIARGNYQVQVEYGVPNDLGLLIDSFNAMAQKLYETEQLQNQYEENRKALVANISHDLKTPITAMRGYLEALLEGGAENPADRERYLQTIHHNTVYINRLIDDLFLFAKLDMDKLEFYREPVAIRSFMADVMEEYAFQMEEKDVRFRYSDQMEKDCRVNLDGKRFHQAVENLMDNAVKHGRKEGKSVEAVLYFQDGQVALAIKDNGPGIPEAALPHVFDRFYRADPERKKDYTCTGLGLAIARELVEAHGGKITVDSQAGEGAEFVIWLPVWTDGAERGMGDADTDH